MRGTTITQRTGHRLLTIVVAAATAITTGLVAPAALPFAGPAPAAHAEPGGDLAGQSRGWQARLATGSTHTCVLLDSGDVSCWGANDHGQLGNGLGTTVTIGDDEEPIALNTRVALPGGRPAVAVAAGDVHTCAILDTGAVACWGEADSGRLGYGNTTDIGDNETPAANSAHGGLVPLGTGVRAVGITAGYQHTCVVTDTAKVVCWGRGSEGQLGYGNQNAIGDDETPAALAATGVALPGIPAQVTAGTYHTCALLTIGRVTCWGQAVDGQLGYGNQTAIGDNETPAANPVGGGLVHLGFFGFSSLPVTVTAIDAGAFHTCVVLASNGVKCWGYGSAGRLGTGNSNTIGDNEHPAVLPELFTDIGAHSVAAGGGHTCVVLLYDAVSCFGGGGNGQLGYGNTQSIGDNEGVGAIVSLPTGTEVRAAETGLEHTCAITFTDQVTCWGYGLNGRLGYGNSTSIGDNEIPALNPVNNGIVRQQARVGGATALAVGHGGHSCAIARSGQVSCWGDNSFGQLGLGHINDIGDNEPPQQGGQVPLPSGFRAISLAIGEFHTCALTTVGRVFCWGRGADGRLGTGNTNNVGDDNRVDQEGVLVSLPGGRRVTAIAAGLAHTCALMEGGAISCWGLGATGQLGYGNTNSIGDNETPAANPSTGGLVQTPSGMGAIAIGAGAYHTCAVLTDLSLTCWGDGADGRLGYGNTNDIGDNETPNANPVNTGRVPLGAGVKLVEVSGGAQHTCARRTDGKVACWGSNGFGQLGTGAGTGAAATIGDNETPESTATDGVVPLAITSALSVTAGWVHTCVLDENGAPHCWGAGSAGRLGYGNANDLGDNETAAAAGAVPFPQPLRQVAANNSHTCGVLGDGRVYCWGYSVDGRLGISGFGNVGDTEAVYTTLGTSGVALPGSLAAPELNSLNPLRVMDTRSGMPYDGGIGNGVPLAPAVTLKVKLAGRTGVPSDATAVAVNVTSVGAAGAGFLQVFPCGSPSGASLLNVSGAAPTPNHAVIALDALGFLCVTTSVTTHVLVDVSAAAPPTSGLRAISPVRMLDTRPTGVTIDGVAQAGGAIAAGGTIFVPIADRAGIPINAGAAWVNLIAVNPSAGGYLTAYPCGAALPNASLLNVAAGTTRANGGLVKIGNSSSICIFSSVATHLVLDVMAYTGSRSLTVPRSPARILDTRPTGLTIDTIGQAGGQLGGNTETVVPLAGRAGVLPSTRQVVLNLTAIGTANGYVQVRTCGSGSTGSTVNVLPGQAVANSVVVALDTRQRLCIVTSVSMHLIIDLEATVH